MSATLMWPQDMPSRELQGKVQIAFRRRLTNALQRRLARLYFSLRYRRIVFGRRCDIRRGFYAIVGSAARVEFGEGCVLDRRLTLECSGTLTVGPRTIFGHDVTIASQLSVEIGADCMFAEMVSIRDHDHEFGNLQLPARSQGFKRAPVRIGRNVWLGSKVTVIKGVTIGDNVVVGANAVVTRDIPANAIAVGVPAKVIRMR